MYVYIIYTSFFHPPFLCAVEINAAISLETLRPAHYPQSASLGLVRKVVSYGLFYAAFVGGALLCFGYWFKNTRRKDDGDVCLFSYFCTPIKHIIDMQAGEVNLVIRLPRG